MTNLRQLLAVPIVLLATATGLARGSEIIDGAELFSQAAIRQADATLTRAEKSTGHSVVIETVASLRGQDPDAVARRNAGRHNNAAIYIMIAKAEGKYRLKEHTARLSGTELQEVNGAFLAALKKRDFDGALTSGSERLASALATVPHARANANVNAPVRRGPAQAVNRGGSGLGFLLTIGLIVIGVLIVVRLLGALSGAGQGGMAPGGMRPGMGGGYGGGYGGGGGGFFSSLMGGIGGAMAGNWLYDQFRGGHHGAGYDASNTAGYDDAGAANDPGWVDGGGGDFGGDAGAGGDAGGGGDWGGGGGGDWGGGGGGDWGGGGGGDW